MSGIIERRPFVGIAAAVIFSALGLLLIGVEVAPGKNFLRIFYLLVGYFLLFVAALSFIAGLLLIVRTFRNK